jgi:transcriptional regulator with XRE-family HTH domain
VREGDTVATLLRVTRAAVGISQSDLAQIAGIERVRLSEFEHGRRVPAEGVLLHLLATLGRLALDGRSETDGGSVEVVT